MKSKVVGLERLSEESFGHESGFLSVRRVRMVNVRDDGSRSAPFVCDFAVRHKGSDAVAVVIYQRAAHGTTRVLLRYGLRPPLQFGRSSQPLPVPDAQQYLFFREVVAGIIEQGDHGEEGILKRAALEVWEEAGLRVEPTQIVFLGAGIFPAAGALPEKIWLCAVEVPGAAQPVELPGDGSPMEDGAHTEWLELDEAISACVRGEMEDAKTELALRRLRDRLHVG
jgi:ADP-ribose pyrophosphatase